MSVDYSDTVGWPSEGTPLRVEPERIGPRVVTRERREECREANAKWLASKANREKARVAKREYHRRQAALRIIRRAAAAMGAGQPGSAP